MPDQHEDPPQQPDQPREVQEPHEGQPNETLPAAPRGGKADAQPASLPESLLTVNQVAVWFNVPKGWVYDRVRDRTLPFLRLGHYLRFERVPIQAYLDECALNEP